MENLGYYNGKYGLIEEMFIQMNDRVCYFGDGVYDASCCANGTIFALDEHIDRFYHGGSLLDIQIPMEKKGLKTLLNNLVTKVEAPTQFVYWQVTRGTADREHAFPVGASPNLWITIRPHTPPKLSRPCQLITIEDTRHLHCHIKTLNLIPNAMAAQRARESGCHEAVLHRNGRVTECTRSNVSILKDGSLKTAPTDNLILPGIARAHLLAMCHKQGIPVIEVHFTLEELMNADEVLITSSTVFCLFADTINGKPVGGKAPEVVGALQNALWEEFQNETGLR